jgi:hypothetical protein
MNLSDTQKKILGMALMVIFGLFEFLFIAVLIGSAVFDSEEASAENTISFLFVIGIFAFPVWAGFRLWKSGSREQVMSREGNESIDVGRTQPIKVTTKVELAEYRRLVFFLTYRTPIFLFLHLLLISLVSHSIINGNGDYFVLFLVILLLFLPVSIYLSATSNYKATKMLHEPVTYEFHDDSFTASGESFTSTMTWKSLHTIKEFPNWFLLKPNKQMAMVIPKSAFSNDDDLQSFRSIAQKNFGAL